MKRNTITFSGVMFTASGLLVYFFEGALWMAVFCLTAAFLLEMANIGMRGKDR